VIITDRRVVEWVARKLGADFGLRAQGIGLERAGQIVAGVVYENWNGVSCVVHIAIDAPLSKDYLRAICHYPFVHGGLRRLIAPVSQGNRKSITFVEKFGFRKEAQILDASPDGSILLYTLDRDQCRFIEDNRHGQVILAAARA